MKIKQPKHLCVVNLEKNFQLTAHYGVLIGHKRQADTKSDFVVSNFIETPSEHADKLKPPSASWLAQHAIQIKRMLIGGQLVLGFYGIDPVKIKVDGLCEVAIKKLKKSENLHPETSEEITYFWLYGDSSKWTCSQFCMKDDIPIRFIEPETMQYLNSSWEINLKFVISSSAPLTDQIEAMIRNEEDKIHEAISLLDNDLVISKQSSPFLNLVVSKESNYKKNINTNNNNNKNTDRQVTLLMTGIKNLGYYSESLTTPLERVFYFSGKIVSNVCVIKCTKFEAVEAVKKDISNSLRNRFIIWKEGLQDVDEQIPEHGQEFKITLPSRVIFSYQNTRLCDYKENNETIQDCKLRCQEILGKEWRSVLYLETEIEDSQGNGSKSNITSDNQKNNASKNGNGTEINKNSGSGSENKSNNLFVGKENSQAPAVLFNYKMYFMVFVALIGVLLFIIGQ
jgi:hypothetical protein